MDEPSTGQNGPSNSDASDPNNEANLIPPVIPTQSKTPFSGQAHGEKIEPDSIWGIGNRSSTNYGNELNEVKGATLRTSLAAVAIALLVYFGPRSGDVLGDAIAFSLLPWFLLASGRITDKFCRVLLALTPLFAIPAAFITTEAVLSLNYLLTALIVLYATFFSTRADHPWRPSELGSRAASVGWHITKSPSFLSEGLTREGKSKVSVKDVLIGVAIAVPVLIVFGILLTYADANFARFVGKVKIGELGWRTLGAVAVFFLAGALIRAASTTYHKRQISTKQHITEVPILITLLAIVVLYVVFVLMQILLIISDGAAKVELDAATISSGARDGMFVLIAVSGLTVGLLLLSRLLVRDYSKTGMTVWRVLSVVMVTSTLLMLILAVARSVAYIEAYGLTSYRINGLIAAAFIAIALTVLGYNAISRSQLSPKTNGRIIIVAGLILALVTNGLNIEKLSVDHNWSNREQTRGGFDASYAGGLSETGIAAGAKYFGQMSLMQKKKFVQSACLWDRYAEDRAYDDTDTYGTEMKNWLEDTSVNGLFWNHSKVNAKKFLHDNCYKPEYALDNDPTLSSDPDIFSPKEIY